VYSLASLSSVNSVPSGAMYTQSTSCILHFRIRHPSSFLNFHDHVTGGLELITAPLWRLLVILTSPAAPSESGTCAGWRARDGEPGHAGGLRPPAGLGLGLNNGLGGSTAAGAKVAPPASSQRRPARRSLSERLRKGRESIQCHFD
jgi:hypothetical protein